MLIDYVETHRDQFGVEPICTVLTEAGAKIAPSTYYAARKRPPSERALSDAILDERIKRIYADNYGVFGARKMWVMLNREHVTDEHGQPTGARYPHVPRCAVERRMRALGLSGAVAGDHKRARTTIPAKDCHPADRLNRDFTAPAPDTRWVADITYVPTWVGFVYVAFVMDLFSRRIVGWRVTASLHTDLALDALNHAIWQRHRQGRTLDGLVHHADRGVQYRAIRYTERLEELGIVASVGSKGDSYDNAAAEALNRVFKTELIRRRGPWRTLEHVELEVLAWVAWYNTTRPHSWCADLSPAAYEDDHYAALNPSPATAEEAHTTLH